jgi:hypothetical protein
VIHRLAGQRDGLDRALAVVVNTGDIVHISGLTVSLESRLHDLYDTVF